jgi:hypothetical protein
MNTLLPLAIAAGLLAGCGEKSADTAQPTNAPASTPAAATTNAPASGGGLLTAPVDYLAAVSKAQQSAVKTVDVASLNQAIQTFNVEEGRYPKSLDELVEKKIIGKLPAVPYGMKYVYDASSGQVKVVRQ